MDKVLARADRKIVKAIDSGSYEKLIKALEDAGYDIDAATADR